MTCSVLKVADRRLILVPAVRMVCSAAPSWVQTAGLQAMVTRHVPRPIAALQLGGSSHISAMSCRMNNGYRGADVTACRKIVGIVITSMSFRAPQCAHNLMPYSSPASPPSKPTPQTHPVPRTAQPTSLARQLHFRTESGAKVSSPGSSATSGFRRRVTVDTVSSTRRPRPVPRAAGRTA